ncbi:class I SAM-dependent methyltransferase [Amycolatopsis sp. NPDC049691]|uniref:SAM-dependent methyltransferase n=1 Tax=Amycolatopsis sp. NPDC049691 TaxID=3155155 RepID=UPI003435185D
MDLPRSFTVRESGHRIHNPLTSRKLAVLGKALNPPPGPRVLDLACGSGELLCTWARDHGSTGTGVDISTVFVAAARARAIELEVAGQVTFLHGDASNHVAGDPVDIAACVGASWIGGGVAGTVDLLRRSLRPGGVLLIGEPYWRKEPRDGRPGQLGPLCRGSMAQHPPLAGRKPRRRAGGGAARGTHHRSGTPRPVPTRVPRLGGGFALMNR